MSHEKARGSDDWFTPRYIFDAIGEEFDLDVASPPGDPRYAPAKNWISPPRDGLSESWTGFVWMNPPFGHQEQKRRWLGRFFEHGHGIALVPDRTSAPWFQEYAPRADLICWLSPKVKFERPDGTRGDSPGNGTALFAAGERAARALGRSGLGFTTVPKARLDLGWF